MGDSLLPFDTSQFEQREISSFIYEPVLGDGTTRTDFRVVYASDVFAKAWHDTYHNDNYLGALLRESTLMDEYTLGLMERFITEKPFPFVSFIPMANMHLFFEPMEGLPEPYGGFFITVLTKYFSQDARDHFLRDVQELSSNAVLLRHSENGSIEPVFVSDEFAQMMECTQAEAMQLISGLGFFKTTKPEDRPLVRSMLRNKVAYDGSSTITIRKVTSKRNVVWCKVHYAFFEDFGESYIYCTYTDVATLKGYEERLRSIYSNLGSSFYQIDDKTLTILRVNLTKDSIEEVRGKDPYDSDSVMLSYTESLRQRATHYLIPSERTRFLETFDKNRLCEQYAEGHATTSQMLYSARKDGRFFYVEISVSITRHPLSGDVIAFFTERECDDEKVKETISDKILTEQFDMVAYISNGRYGITIGDSSKIKHGNIFPSLRKGEYLQYLNSQVVPALSGSEDEISEMRHALELETVVEKLKVAEPYVVNIAIELDGKTYYKQFDFYGVNPDAQFYILLIRDTTEIQQEHFAMNERLRSALDAANQANVAKTSFLSSMSHEIRTPMNAIIGLNSIMLNDPDISDSTRESLEKMRGSAKHLLGLINDVLDMSRIESGRMTIKHEEFSFSEMIGQISTMIGSQCQDKGLDFQCELIGSPDEKYIGDAMKLKQVIINILGNAVKFTPAPGTVRFTIEKVAEYDDKTTLSFVMADTGVGMDAEYLPKIFDAFTQEDEGKANKYGSTGLGMAITKNIVDLMNGEISVESEKGVGSVFTVEVTLRNCEQNIGQLSDIDPRTLHALIIDDDPVACEHAKIVLGEIAITADTALSGDQALEMVKLKSARGEAYNLIFVDWKMPVKDGVQVTRELRSAIGPDSVIIALTGYDWEKIEDEATEAGVDSFMAKPLFANSVIEAYRQALANRKVASSSETEPADLNGRLILVAEDIEINAEIVEATLEMEGMSMNHAANGQIAVDMFAASEPGTYDAVLMDVRMPVLDGLAATRAIRALDHPDAKTVPIIAMTANAFDEDVQRTLQAGMNAHLAKPVDPDILFTTLGNLIRD